MSEAALPWLDATLDAALGLGRAHAVLVQGSVGDGLFEAATRIATTWLCEAEPSPARRPCGQCTSCRHLASSSHPDLRRLTPEELQVQLGLADAEPAEGAEGESRKGRKPSRQIRIDDVRAAIEWLSTSSARGKGKVVLVHPAEALNPQSANALLKTLEEPPRGARLLLSSARPDVLLPTVRSRCQVVRLEAPTADAARRWLQTQGLAEPEVLLAAMSGRPLDALALAASGVDPARWNALPRALLDGNVAALAGWSPPRVLDALQKLAHDGLALAHGAPPRFFGRAGLTAPRSAAALADWSRELVRIARQIEHPWNEGLLLESLVVQARRAWTSDVAGSQRASDTLGP